MKYNKREAFDFDRVCNDSLEGRIRGFSAFPDLSGEHKPHVDLKVWTNEGAVEKYRIYDAPATYRLRDTFGDQGTSSHNW